MRTDPSRFDRVEAHPDYGKAPPQPVLPADQVLGTAALVGPMVATILWGAVLLFVITTLIATHTPLLTSLIVIGICAVVVVSRVNKVRGLIAMRDTPIQKLTAVVVKERTEVSGTDRASRTRYYATLQTRDGQRVEYRVADALTGRIVVDDIGVAYVRDTIVDLRVTQIQVRTLVEFIRFDVD